MVDRELNRIVAALRPAERAAIKKHLAGNPTLVSQRLMRRIRRRLKRAARAGRR